MKLVSAFRGSVADYTRAIDKCARSKAWQAAIDLLEDMLCLRIRCDALAFTGIMSACAKGHHWQGSLDAFGVMQQISVAPNGFTYSAALSALSRVTQWTRALKLFAEAQVNSIRMDTILCSTAITACEKGHQWELALAALRHMLCLNIAVSTASFNATISACEKGNKWAKAIGLLAEMGDLLVVADTISYNAAISACEKKAKWDWALRLLVEMQRHQIVSDLITYSAVISACEKGNQWEKALLYLMHLQDCRLPVSTVSYSAAISACEKGGQLGAAFRIWEDMKNNNIPADTTTYNALISACEKGLHWKMALEQFAEMVRVEIESTAISYYAVMRACERCGKWELVMDLVSAMLEQHISDSMTARVPYSHDIQAGSVLDCFKHLVLIHVLQHMVIDDSPFLYVDLHAGAGIYNLQSPQAKIHGNAEHGVRRLYEIDTHGLLHPLVCYVESLREFNESPIPEHLQYYFGSPAWALKWLRPKDRAILLEANADVYNDLVRNLASFDWKCCLNVTAVHADSYRWLTQTPFSTCMERSLILIDPPYDSYDSYTAWNLFMVQHVRKLWPNSCVLLWYPCRNSMELSSFYQRVQTLRFGGVLVAEFEVESSSASLNHSGMLLVNPPSNIELQLKALLPALARMLVSGTMAEFRTSVFWLTQE